MVEEKEIEAAAEKAGRFSFDFFRSEVLPYLTDELIEAYRQAADFQRLKDETNAKLIEMLR